MIPRIKSVKPMKDYVLNVIFDNGKNVLYDMNEDIDTLAGYGDLKSVYGLFAQMQVDDSRTCVFWNENIDLPSDIIYEYGKELSIR